MSTANKYLAITKASEDGVFDTMNEAKESIERMWGFPSEWVFVPPYRFDLVKFDPKGIVLGSVYMIGAWY